MVGESLSQLNYEITSAAKPTTTRCLDSRTAHGLIISRDISEMAPQLRNSRSVGRQPVPKNWIVISITFP